MLSENITDAVGFLRHGMETLLQKLILRYKSLAAKAEVSILFYFYSLRDESYNDI